MYIFVFIKHVLNASRKILTEQLVTAGINHELQYETSIKPPSTHLKTENL